MFVFVCLAVLADPPPPSLYPADRPIVVPLWNRVGDFSTRLRSIEAAEFSPNGRLAISGAKFGYDVILWRVVDGTAVWQRQHESEVECVGFSPDGRLAATGGEDFAVRIWDVATGDQRRVLKHPRGLDALTWHGDTLAAGDEDGVLHLWDTAADDPADWTRRSQFDTGDTINSIAFTADGSRIVVGGNLQTVESGTRHFVGFVKLIDAATGETIRDYGPLAESVMENGQTPPMRAGSIKSVAISPDGQTVGCGGFGRACHLFDLQTGELKQTIRSEHRFEAVAFTATGHYFVVGGHEAAIRFYRMSDGQLAYEHPTIRCEYIDFTNDGRLMLTSHEDSGLLSLSLLASDLQRNSESSPYHRLANEQLDNRDLQPPPKPEATPEPTP